MVMRQKIYSISAAFLLLFLTVFSSFPAFAAGGDVFLADETQDLAILDERGGADRAVRGQDGKSDDGRNSVATGGDLHQGVFTKFEEGGFAQKVECRGSADGLLGENHQIGVPGLCLVDGIDDFRGIPVNITDCVVQLGDSNFHVSNLSRKNPSRQS